MCEIAFGVVTASSGDASVVLDAAYDDAFTIPAPAIKALESLTCLQDAEPREVAFFLGHALVVPCERVAPIEAAS
jgi:hypothetical protein